MKHTSIPVFAHLYGDLESPRQLDELHSERLEQRSGFHDWTIKPHRHDQLHQLFAVSQGGGEATIDGKTIYFEAPFIIYVPALTVHSFRYVADSSGFVISAFRKEVSTCLEDLPELISLVNHPLNVSGDNDDKSMIATLKLFMQFHDEYRGLEPGRVIALRSLLSLILVDLSRSASKESEAVSKTGTQDQERLSELLELIEKHYANHHSTEFYAKAMHVTLPKLRQMTQSILGMSAHQLVVNKIMLEAKRNILYTSMTASQIADMLGFKDPAYFSRFFKKHTGESPSEYRKRA